MSVSRFRVPRSAATEVDGLSASSMLRYVLGYDALTETPETVATNPFIARLCHDIDDAGLISDWAALEADGIASVFQAYTWQRGLITHLVATSGAKPLFVTIRETRTDHVVAIFPLQQRRWRGATLIDYLAADFCDTCQPLLSADMASTPDVAAALVEALLSALPAADVLQLAKMQRSLFGLANPFADLPGCGPSPDATFPVELAADAAGFVGATSAYKTYQKQWRKLSRRDGIAFEMFETPEAIASAFDAMIVMRNSRFTDLKRDDLLDDPKVAAFYRDMALLPVSERVVRIAGLKVGDAYTAYIYMMDRGGKFSTVISAMDNSVGNAYAPGLILFTKIFERAVETGYAHGDIGIGYMHYKTRFSSRPNPLFIWEHPLSTKGRVMLAALNAARATKRWAQDNKTIRVIAEKMLKRRIGPQVTAPKAETADED